MKSRMLKKVAPLAAKMAVVAVLAGAVVVGGAATGVIHSGTSNSTGQDVAGVKWDAIGIPMP